MDMRPLAWSQKDEQELRLLKAMIEETLEDPESNNPDTPAAIYLQQLRERVLKLGARRIRVRCRILRAQELLTEANAIHSETINVPRPIATPGSLASPRHAQLNMASIGAQSQQESAEIQQQQIYDTFERIATTNPRSNQRVDNNQDCIQATDRLGMVAVLSDNSDVSESKSVEYLEECKEEPLPQRPRSRRRSMSQSRLSFAQQGAPGASRSLSDETTEEPSPTPTRSALGESTGDNSSVEDTVIADAAATSRGIRSLRKEYMQSLMLPPTARTSGRKWDAARMRQECERLGIPFKNSGLKKLAEKLALQAH